LATFHLQIFLEAPKSKACDNIYHYFDCGSFPMLCNWESHKCYQKTSSEFDFILRSA